jgi:hypothetical protein
LRPPDIPLAVVYREVVADPKSATRPPKGRPLPESFNPFHYAPAIIAREAASRPSATRAPSPLPKRDPHPPLSQLQNTPPVHIGRPHDPDEAQASSPMPWPPGGPHTTRRPPSPKRSRTGEYTSQRSLRPVGAPPEHAPLSRPTPRQPEQLTPAQRQEGDALTPQRHGDTSTEAPRQQRPPLPSQQQTRTTPQAPASQDTTYGGAHSATAPPGPSQPAAPPPTVPTGPIPPVSTTLMRCPPTEDVGPLPDVPSIPMPRRLVILRPSPPPSPTDRGAQPPNNPDRDRNCKPLSPSNGPPRPHRKTHATPIAL